MRSAIWRGSLQSTLSANTVRASPFSAQPTIQPSDGLPASAPHQPALGPDDGIADLGHRQDIAHQLLAAFGHRQHAPAQPVDEIDLLDGIDAQIAGEPELVDAAADIAVAVFEQVDIFLHPLRADAARDLLIDRHRGGRDRRAQGVVVVPGLDASDHAVPFEDILVGIADHAGFQRDHRIRNLEGRGRQHPLPGTILVAGDDEIVVDLVAHEGADGFLVEKVLGEAIAELGALLGDVGQAARRNEAGGGKKAERMAAIDQNVHPV